MLRITLVSFLWIFTLTSMCLVGCGSVERNALWGIGKSSTQIDSVSYVGLRRELVDSLKSVTNANDFFYIKALWEKSGDCGKLIQTWNRILSLYKIDRLHLCLESGDPQTGSYSLMALAGSNGQGLLISVRPPHFLDEIPPIRTLLIDSAGTRRLLSRFTTGIELDSIKPNPGAAEEDPAVQFCFLSTPAHNYRWLIVGTQYHGDELSRKLLMRFDELMQRPY